MSSVSETCVTCVALVLAAMAAIASAHGGGTESYRALEAALMASAAPDAAPSAQAFSNDPSDASPY